MKDPHDLRTVDLIVLLHEKVPSGDASHVAGEDSPFERDAMAAHRYDLAHRADAVGERS